MNFTVLPRLSNSEVEGCALFLLFNHREHRGHRVQRFALQWHRTYFFYKTVSYANIRTFVFLRFGKAEPNLCVLCVLCGLLIFNPEGMNEKFHLSLFKTVWGSCCGSLRSSESLCFRRCKVYILFASLGHCHERTRQGAPLAPPCLIRPGLPKIKLF